MTSDSIAIDIYSDVVCPWCYVGKRRLERALASWNGSLSVKIQWRPFQLNPTMPREGMDRRTYLEAKFGEADAARAIYDQVTAAGAVEHIPFAFDRIARTPNTFAAHRLIWWAGQHGKQDEMVETLFRRYFLDGGDIGGIDGLSLAAVGAGLDRATTERFLSSADGVEEVRAEETAGRRLDIRGVPYFVFNGADALSGAQPPEQFVATFREVERSLSVRKAGA
ncbi:MAG: disulfide bond formation protein DsbA [Nitrospira sp. WS238]|nr:disulfide bond formation protein DsbA [Nitrospira sp. WS238]